jgi:hypothetical protein
MKEVSIEISIDELGILEAETFGFKGKVCEEELKNLLSSDFIIEEFDWKDDYHKAETEAVVTEKIRGKKL